MKKRNKTVKIYTNATKDDIDVKIIESDDNTRLIRIFINGWAELELN